MCGSSPRMTRIALLRQLFADDALGEKEGFHARWAQARLREDSAQIIAKIVAEIGLVKIARESLEQSIETGAVAKLKRIHENQTSAGLEHAEEFSGNLPAHLTGNLVKKIDRSDEIEAR